MCVLVLVFFTAFALNVHGNSPCLIVGANMDRLPHFVLALAVVAVLALLVSSDRNKIRIRYVIQLLVIYVLLAWFFLNSVVGLGFLIGFSDMF